MIDTYMDRADAATGGRRRENMSDYYARMMADPRYYKGNLYATVIDRTVAEARDRLADSLERDRLFHRFEILINIKLGTQASRFTTKGTRK